MTFILKEIIITLRKTTLVIVKIQMKYLIALGSNLGDRKNNINQAISKISDFAIVEAVSSIYETKALLPEGAPVTWAENFYNSAILITAKPSFTAHELLQRLKQIETEMGRPQIYKKWAPRIIDLDIIIGPEDVSTEGLIVPHPQLAMRDFVLIPCREIAHDYYIKSLGKKFEELDVEHLEKNVIRKV